MSVGKLFHLVHTVDNAEAAEAWYREVLGAREFLPLHTLEPEKRDAALVVMADAVLEPVSPSFGLDGWAERPFGRYYQRFGKHWHSLAWYTDDPGDLWKRCQAGGVQTLGMNGPVTEPPAASDTLFTHPRDTFAQMQFTPVAGSRYEALDPRLRPGWDGGWWRDEHPLGLIGAAYLMVLCRSLDDGLRVYADVLGGRPLGTGTCALTGTEYTDVAVGDAVVRLATPVSENSGRAAEDLAANGTGVHAVAFEVSDLDRAAGYLHSKGVEVLDRDATTLLTDPATTLGVPFHWTVRRT